MKLLLLGATGRTGKHVLNYALEKGYHVSCLARKPERLPTHHNLSVFEGNPTNSVDLQKAMEGCKAVVSVLNISRISDFPWANLRTPKTFLSDSMANLIALAEKNTINKFVLCSAWGVRETRNDIPFWFRWTIKYSNIKYAYLDHEKQEELLRKSNINHTIVRPVGLTNFNKKIDILESKNNEPKPQLFISRKAVATFLVGCLDSETKRKIVTISNS
ncbi:NAD(P)-dependent oxidoreductase [Maribacter antarcticus]|uniref:NAD(P)-dependent oxidoreductase n=1 Tax=Maribacter antarcticus TaxID=505250 RepID=UPI000479792C|nr:NAD(P)-binding oxidoreductase [Maribacter antarcticus]